MTSLDQLAVSRIIREALKEDIGRGDLTSETILSEEEWLKLKMVSREEIVVVGLDIASQVFYCLAPETKIHCHAKDGKGNGPVNDVTKGVIACPDLTDTTTEIKSSGAIFHVITHGKGIMGPHASQLNKDERWKLVEYIRTDLKKLPIENPINNNHIDSQQSVDNNTVSMPNNENINTN